MSDEKEPETEQQTILYTDIYNNVHDLPYVRCPHCKRIVWLSINWRENIKETGYLEISCLCHKTFRVNNVKGDES